MTQPVLVGTVGGERGRLEDQRAYGSFGIAHALEQIEGDYGVTVRVKPKTLFKFGQTNNADSGVKTTVATFQGAVVNETYATGNDIDSIVSDDNGDTEEIVVEGHTLSGSDLTFVSQTVTLTGQTIASLTTPLYRATRAYNNGSSELAGNVYIFDNDNGASSGTPNTATETKLVIPAGLQQSEKCATALSQYDYWIITQVYCAVAGTTAADVDIQLEVREFGKVFRSLFETTVRSTGQSAIAVNLDPPIIAPANSDVRLRATSDTANTTVDGWINGYLALDQDSPDA